MGELFVFQGSIGFGVRFLALSPSPYIYTTQRATKVSRVWEKIFSPGATVACKPVITRVS